ncbi:MAG: phage Gp37/Gp68 family protein, partial [Chloroflexota bacterium]|nr:phage Gp37/Gp68 family protein [Chloroflexota bacterium]
MADKSGIEWTDATWNPVTGCTQVSPGCDHCYALTFAERFRSVPGHPYEQGFDLKLWPQRLELPLRWKRPRRVFVNSMSDLFHRDVSDEYVAAVFDVMVRADQHIFQVLTKRSTRLAKLAPMLPWPSNVWVGVSIETE